LLISLGIFQAYHSQWLSKVFSASNSVIKGWGILCIIGTNLTFPPKYPKICFRCINDSSVNTGISSDKEEIIVHIISWSKGVGLTNHDIKDRNQIKKDQEICMNIFKSSLCQKKKKPNNNKSIKKSTKLENMISL